MLRPIVFMLRRVSHLRSLCCLNPLTDPRLTQATAHTRKCRPLPQIFHMLSRCPTHIPPVGRRRLPDTECRAWLRIWLQQEASHRPPTLLRTRTMQTMLLTRSSLLLKLHLTSTAQTTDRRRSSRHRTSIVHLPVVQARRGTDLRCQGFLHGCNSNSRWARSQDRTSSFRHDIKPLRTEPRSKRIHPITFLNAW